MNTEDQNLAVLAHLSSLAGFVIPFGNLIAPLVIWQIYKDSKPAVGNEAKECLNFQITVTIYSLIAGLLILVLVGAVLLPLILVFWLVCTIIAAVRVSKGESYQYPLTIRLIK